MLKHEFETLAGYEVSNEDYTTVIEPMYMATDLSKSEFVKVIDRKRFELKKEKSPKRVKIEQEIKEEIETLKEDIKYYQERIDVYNEFYKLDGDKTWKVSAKDFKMTIQSKKRRISELKFVLA